MYSRTDKKKRTVAKIVETPLMKQYFDIKAKHSDAILLFRVGDFYEMYGEDAVTGAEILGIVQTEKKRTDRGKRSRWPVSLTMH